MARKRDRPPETVLQDVITGLESDQPARHRHAILTLLSEGPFMCGDVLVKELEQPATENWDVGTVRVIDVLRAEFLAFLRGVVRRENLGTWGDPIALHGRLIFRSMGVDRRVVGDVGGAMRDVAILQLMVLLDRVGLGNVRKCEVGDCARLFVKTYRRAFCSVRCQQRDGKRRQRARELEKEQQQARRQRRRSRGQA